MSMNPIAYVEIDAYCRLMSVKLSAFDVQAIKQLDSIAISESNRE